MTTQAQLPPPNRYGPSSAPQLPTMANPNGFFSSPYNFQASMLGMGNPGSGMYGYSNMLPYSQNMQRFLPEVTRHAMTNGAQWNAGNPWSMGPYGQPAQQPNQPNQPNAALRDLRQDYRSSLTPEQLALKGGENGNTDFRQSLTPEQIAQRQQLMQMRQQGQQGAQGAPQPQPQQTSGYGSYYQNSSMPAPRQGMPFTGGMPQYGQPQNMMYRPQYGQQQFSPMQQMAQRPQQYQQPMQQSMPQMGMMQSAGQQPGWGNFLTNLGMMSPYMR